MMIALTSARSSPGVTTLATGLSLSFDELDGPCALIEADPCGGVLGHRFGLGGSKDMLTFASDSRKSFEPDTLFKHTRGLGRVHCLLSPVDPAASEKALNMSAGMLARELPRYRMHTVVDCGRLSEQSASLPLLAKADHALVVTRPTLDDIQAVLFSIRLLTRVRSTPPSLILVGDNPYTATEITRSLGFSVVGVIADDPKMSRALCGGRFTARQLRRSIFMRSISSLAERLHSMSTVEPSAELSVERAGSDLRIADQVGVLSHD